MISLTGLISQKAFGKFEMGKVISNPFANAFIKEAEGEDHEVSMANNSIDTIIKMATELKAKMGEDEKEIPAWIQDHIAKAENLISQASSNYHEYGNSNEDITEASDAQLVKDMEITIKNLQYMLTKAKHPKEKENLKSNIAANIAIMNWWKSRGKNESVNEAPAKNTGEKIQNLNNRIKVLRAKITAQKDPRKKSEIQATLKNALQRLSDIRKDYGIKAPHREGVTEIKFDKIRVLSKEEFQNEAGPCWKGYKQVGMKNKGGKSVPNCVPESKMTELSSNVPKIFIKTAAVEKKIKELMADRKKAVVPYNNETDPAKKEKLKQILIKLTNQIKGYEKNLIQLRDMEEEYLQQMHANVELDTTNI